MCVCLHKGYVDSAPQPSPQGLSSKMRNPANEVERSFPFLCCLNASFQTHLPSAYNLTQTFLSDEKLAYSLLSKALEYHLLPDQYLN